MEGLKNLLAHKRTWAIVIGLVFQALAPLLHLVLNDPGLLYVTQNLPVLLAGLWTALVLGQAYEDRVTRGASSAITVHRDPGRKEGGWKHALLSLLRNEKFVATLFGTVLAVLALAAPQWPGLAHLEETFVQVAQLVTMLTGSLTVGLAYSAAHDGSTRRMSNPSKDPEVETGD